MWCTFFIYHDGDFPLRIGPVEVTGLAEVNRLAEMEYARSPDTSAIDVWEAAGALYRLPRTDPHPNQPIPFRLTPAL